MTPGRKYTLAVAARLLWRNSWIAALLVAIGGAAAYAYVSRLPNLYRAQTTVLVLPQLVPQNFVRSTVTQAIDDQLRVLSESVFAPDSLATLARELQLFPGAQTATTEQLAAAVRARVSLNIVRADAFRVAAIHLDPRLAARLADRVAQAFVEENLRSRAGMAEETDQFLEAQLESTRQRLSAQEQKLEEYRRTYSGQLPSQLSSNLQVLQNAQEQLRAATDAVHAERERKLKIEQAIASLVATADQPAADQSTELPEDFDPLKDRDYVVPEGGREARQQLPVVRSRLRALELQLKPDHPDIVRLQRIIEELERRAAQDGGSDRPATAPGDAERDKTVARLRAELTQTDRRLDERVADEARLRGLIEEYQRRVELIPTRETELTTLMRDYDTLREGYNSLLAKKEEAQLAAELERRRVGETFKVAENAAVPGSPFSPNRRQTIAIGAAVGLVLALLIAAWREYADTTLRSESEVVAALELPVVATIPVIAPSTDKRVVVRIVSIVILAIAGLVTGLVAILLVSASAPL